MKEKQNIEDLFSKGKQNKNEKELGEYLMSKLSNDQSDKLNRLLNDEKALNELLSSEKAKNILKKLTEEK